MQSSFNQSYILLMNRKDGNMEIFSVYGVRPVSYKIAPLTKVQIARWNRNQGYTSLRGRMSERKDFYNLTLVGGVKVGFFFIKWYLLFDVLKLATSLYYFYKRNIFISGGKHDIKGLEKLFGFYGPLTYQPIREKRVSCFENDCGIIQFQVSGFSKYFFSSFLK